MLQLLEIDLSTYFTIASSDNCFSKECFFHLLNTNLVNPTFGCNQVHQSQASYLHNIAHRTHRVSHLLVHRQPRRRPREALAKLLRPPQRLVDGARRGRPPELLVAVAGAAVAEAAEAAAGHPLPFDGRDRGRWSVAWIESILVFKPNHNKCVTETGYNRWQVRTPSPVEAIARFRFARRFEPFASCLVHWWVAQLTANSTKLFFGLVCFSYPNFLSCTLRSYFKHYQWKKASMFNHKNMSCCIFVSGLF